MLCKGGIICGLFNDAVTLLDYIESNDWLIIRQVIGKYMEGIGRGIIKVLLRNLRRGTEENHDKSQSG
jgi:hypothetical protein